MRNVPSNVLILFYTFFLHTYFLDINKNNLNNFLILVNLQNCKKPRQKALNSIKENKSLRTRPFLQIKAKKVSKEKHFLWKEPEGSSNSC